MSIPNLGIPLLDAEHRDLIIFTAQIKNDKSDIGKIIDYFLNEVQYHFFHEENFMKSIKYPYLYEHEEEHTRLRLLFLSELLSLQREIDNREEVNKKIQEFSDELIKHFETYDFELAKWLKK